MDNQEIENILDRFFSGEMNEEEKKNFFELVKENDAFKKSYELEKRIARNALEVNDQSYEQNIRNIHKTYINKSEKSNSMKTRTWLGIAASLIVLVSAYFFIKSGPSQGSLDQKKAYMAYLTDYETNSLGKYSLRGGDTEKKTMKDTLAMALHESTNGSMKKAKNLLQELLEKHPENEEVQLYLGIQLYKDSNYSSAIRILNGLIQSQDVEIKEEAEMAMAMATTSLNDNNQTSIKWLKKIANNSQHRHQEIAESQLSFYE